MVLEATVICLDNSEYSRNEDFLPSRFEAQKDTTNLIVSAKTNQNPENAVGVLALAGDRVEVKVTPTNDIAKILAKIHEIKISSKSDFVRGIQIAQLALKHRINKNQKQRIICFFGSPVTTSIKTLEQLGKQLKKNNVSLDIISFGNVDENSEKLQKLFQAVNSNDTSHILEYEGGRNELLADRILSSELAIDGSGVSSSSQINNLDNPSAPFSVSSLNEFGVDPNIDPDLYMAMHLSLQEENARIQREEQMSKAAEDVNAGTTNNENNENNESVNTATQNNDAPNTAPESELPIMENMDEMDDEITQALLMSLQDYAGDTEARTDQTEAENVDSVKNEEKNATDLSTHDTKPENNEDKKDEQN